MEIYEVEDFYKYKKEQNMNSNIFNLNWKDILGAVISAVLVAVLAYIIKISDIFALNIKDVINVAVLAGAGSILKALMTTSEGKLLGVVKVK